MCAAAESVRRYNRFFKNQNALTVLDYGTGTMRNACYLAEQGFTVYAADLPEQVERLRRRPAAARRVKRLLATDELSDSRLGVDLVLSTYVFNIIMAQDERRAYLETAVANLRPGGYLMMEVRCRRPDEACGDSCDDYLSPGACAKTLSHGELDALLAPHGLRRVSHYYRSHALAAIYRRDDTVSYSGFKSKMTSRRRGSRRRRRTGSTLRSRRRANEDAALIWNWNYT